MEGEGILLNKGSCHDASRSWRKTAMSALQNGADGFRSKQNLKRKSRLGETVIQGLLFFSGFLSIFTTIGIVYELGKEALLFFRNPAVTLWEFFTGTQWQPTIEEFGILPL